MANKSIASQTIIILVDEIIMAVEKPINSDKILTESIIKNKRINLSKVWAENFLVK